MSFDLHHTSQFPPSVVFDGKMFHLAFRSNSNSAILYTTSDDGENWESPEKTGETTIGAPAITIADNRPVIVFPSEHAPHRIRYAVRDERTWSWTHSVEIPETISERIVAAVGKPNADIFIYFRAEHSDKLLGASFSTNKKACKKA